MTSPKDRRLVSQRSLERENSKGDDPWCLTCGVNLALEGRTYTVVSRHNNGELCDVFSRVLGAEFSQEYASVNVCNRCERQLRRIGRYNSIILARHEGEKLREQLEKNLDKFGQKVIESGRVEDLPSPTSDVVSSKVIRGESLDSSSGVGTGQGYDGHSSIRRRGKLTSKSVSSVHFEDEGEAERRDAAVRKYSAPAGFVKKRESLSPFSEAQRRREARRRKWSSASSTSEEHTLGSPTTPADRTLLLGGRGVALTSRLHRDARQSSFSSNQHHVPDELTTDNSCVLQEPAEIPEEVLRDFPTPIEEMSSSEDKGEITETRESSQHSSDDAKLKTEVVINSELVSNTHEGSNECTDKELEKCEENSDLVENISAEYGNVQNGDNSDNSPAVWSGRINPFNVEKAADVAIDENVDNGEGTDDAVFLSDVAKEQSLPRMDTLQADDELFTTKLGEEDAQDSESLNEAELDPNDYNADTRSNMSEVEERITTKTKFKGAYYNIGSTEDLLQEFANEQDREKAIWSQLTFSESVDIQDPEDDDSDYMKPVRPPRRSKKGRSSLKGQNKKGGQTLNSPVAEGDENEISSSQNVQEEAGSKVKANGVILEEQRQPSVNVGVTDGDEKTSVTFLKEPQAGNETQVIQDGGLTAPKSEKSPLIGKDGGSSSLKLKNGNESKVKDQMPGFLCCSVL